MANPQQVCDGDIDCQGALDIGADESAEECCDKSKLNIDQSKGEYAYRCVHGKLDPQSHFQVMNTKLLYFT